MYSCPICLARNASLTLLAKHLFLHLKLLPYVCRTCMDSLTSRFIKSYVTENVFYISEKNSFDCESPETASNLCGECYKFIPGFNEFFLHVQIHAPDVNQCSTCILSFAPGIHCCDPKKQPVYKCFSCQTTFGGDPRSYIFEPFIFCNLDKLESHEPDLVMKNKVFKQFKLVFTIQKRSKGNLSDANSLSNASCSAESRKALNKKKPCYLSADRRKVVSKGKPSNFSSYVSANECSKAKVKSHMHKDHASVKNHNGKNLNSTFTQTELSNIDSSFDTHEACFEKHASPSNLSRCLKPNSKAPSPREYYIIKSSGGKLIFKLKASKTGSKSVAHYEGDSISREKSIASPKCAQPALLAYEGKNDSGAPRKLLQLAQRKNNSGDLAKYRKNVTAQKTPCTTSEFKACRNMSSVTMCTSTLTNQTTTTSSPSMPLPSAPSEYPLGDNPMSQTNLSQLVKGSGNLQKTSVNPSMPLSSASSELPSICPSMPPAKSSNLLRDSERLQKKTAVSSSAPLRHYSLQSSASMSDKSVCFNGFKVRNSIFVNYNQSKESAKHLFPFRKFEILKSGGWLNIPVKMFEDTVHPNVVSNQKSPYLVPDQNNLTCDAELQAGSDGNPRKRLKIATNGVQYMDINASDSFQNNQCSVRLGKTEVASIGDSLPELHGSELLNNNNVQSSDPNLKSRECEASFQVSRLLNSLGNPGVITVDDSGSDLNYSNPLKYENSVQNLNSSGCKDSFQNSTVPANTSPHNRLGILKGKISLDCKSKCLNNDLFNADHIDGFKQSKSSEKSDSSNSEHPNIRHSKNAVNSNLKTLEFNNEGNFGFEINPDDPKSVGSPKSEDCDSSESFVRQSGDVVGGIPLRERADSVHSSDPISAKNNNDPVEGRNIRNSVDCGPQSLIEDEYWNKVKRMYNLRELSVHLDRLPNVVGQNTYSSKSERAAQVLNHSEELAVVLTKLPQYVYNYSTYKIYAGCLDGKLTLRRKKNLESPDENLPREGGIHLENNDPMSTIHLKDRNAWTSVPREAISMKNDAQLQYLSDGAELTNGSHSMDVHVAEDIASAKNNFALDYVNQQTFQTSVVASIIKDETDSCIEQNLVKYNQPSSKQITSPIPKVDKNSVSNTYQLPALSTPGSFDASTSDSHYVLAPAPLSDINSLCEHLVTLQENSNSCDYLHTQQVLKGEGLPVPAADPNLLFLQKIFEELHQEQDESESDPSEGVDEEQLYPSFSENSSESEHVFSLWETECQLTYLRNRIQYINEALVGIVKNTQSMKFLEPRVQLHRLHDSVYEKHLKKKPIMLSSILPTITEVRSLSSENS